MKENKITVIIQRPAKDVFSFYINPKNTQLWLSSIILEVTSEWPIKVGTVYKNQDKSGIWSAYRVTALKENELFELVSADGNYHVRYLHRPIDANSSELEYFEWVDQGDLLEPFTIEVLEKLKWIVEELE